MIANTIDAAPLNPAAEMNICCPIGHLSGESMANTAAGRATNVKNRAIAIAGSNTCGIWDGNASSPSRKKISICASPVTPSKKCTSDFLLCRDIFPNRIPAM